MTTSRHGERDPSELHEALAQLVRSALHALHLSPVAVEEEVLGLLHFFVKKGHRFKMAVHQRIEQAIEEKPNAVDGQIGRLVPSSNDGIDIHVHALADRDERLMRDEGRHFVRGQLTRHLVERHRVHAQKEVRTVPVEFGPLALGEGILDGQFVQTKLCLEHAELLGIRAAEVEPDDPVVGLQMIGDVGDGKVLEDHVTIAIEPASSWKVGVRLGLNVDHGCILRHRWSRSIPGHSTVHRLASRTGSAGR